MPKLSNLRIWLESQEELTSESRNRLKPLINHWLKTQPTDPEAHVLLISDGIKLRWLEVEDDDCDKTAFVPSPCPQCGHYNLCIGQGELSDKARCVCCDSCGYRGPDGSDTKDAWIKYGELTNE